MEPQTLINEIRSAIAEIDRHLEQGTFDKDVQGQPCRGELIIIREELEKLLRAHSGDSNDRTNTTSPIGRIITDTWSLPGLPLADKLLDICNAHRRSLRVRGINS